MADSNVEVPFNAPTSISTRTNASGEQMEVVILGIDGSDTVVPTDSTSGLRVNSHGSTLASGTVAIGTTAAIFRASAAARVSLFGQNLGPGNLYLGSTSGVTTATGIKVPVLGTFNEKNYTGTVYAIADQAATDVRYWEVSS